uniref:PYD and CARD domain containing n=2 Tax=Scophthalmus maximus TaxID=52904 RepID=A0A8D2ZT12_SCOMX
MAAKTMKKSIADALEDLSEQDFKKFCSALRDRREEPRIRRNRLEGKGFLEVTDVLVTTFTEPEALRVALELLREIDCNDVAKRLDEETAVSAAARPSSGATGAEAGGCADKHFVDTHKVQLISRVSNIAPILDELLVKEVIHEESYAKIRALATSQEKIRELYATSLKGGKTCKDHFYESLKKNEPYLVKDLQGK